MVQKQSELIVWATIVLAATSASINPICPNNSSKPWTTADRPLEDQIAFATLSDQCQPPAKRMKLTLKSRELDLYFAGSLGSSPELLGDTAAPGQTTALVLILILWWTY